MTLSDVEAERDQLGYNTQESADWLIERVRELEEGIRKHEITLKYHPHYFQRPADESLYKLLEDK